MARFRRRPIVFFSDENKQWRKRLIKSDIASDRRAWSRGANYPPVAILNSISGIERNGRSKYILLVMAAKFTVSFGTSDCFRRISGNACSI